MVAQQVHTSALILGAWIFGGIIAVGGAFIWAELAATMPAVGGQYAYLRDAYHPMVAFLYGWVLLLVIQTGGMAAVSITFVRYFLELTGIHAQDWVVAIAALGVLTLINCLGVKSRRTNAKCIHGDEDSRDCRIGDLRVVLRRTVCTNAPQLIRRGRYRRLARQWCRYYSLTADGRPQTSSLLK